MQDRDDVQEHIKIFFDPLDKLALMVVEINADLLRIMLLCSLPLSYKNFRYAIESRDNLPNVENLKIKILEENDLRKQKNENNNSAMLAAMEFNITIKRNFNKNKSDNYEKRNWEINKTTKSGNFVNDKTKKCYRCDHIRIRSI